MATYEIGFLNEQQYYVKVSIIIILRAVHFMERELPKDLFLSISISLNIAATQS